MNPPNSTPRAEAPRDGAATAEAELRRLGDELDAARRAVERERARYRNLFDLAPDGYLITNAAGTIVEANQAAADLLNIPRQFLAGKPLATFIPPEGLAAFRSELRRLSQEGRIWRYETRVTPRGLAPMHVELSAAAVRDFEGAPAALHWTLADISDRVAVLKRIRALNQELERNALERTAQLEDQIRANEQILIETHAATSASEKSRQQFQEFVQGLDAVIWKADPATGRFTFISQHLADLLGFPVARWLDGPEFWAERLHPDDREWVLKNRQRFAEEGRDHEAEYRLLASDGRAFWFRESVRVVHDPSGAPRELRGLMINISKRKKVERQLYYAKQELSDRLGDLRFLQELAGRLSSALALEPLLAEILAAVLSILGSERGAIVLLDPARDDLAIAAQAGLDDAVAARVGRLPRSSPLFGRVLAVADVVVVEDVTQLLGHASYQALLESNTDRAVASFPLQAGSDDAYLGCVAVFFPEPHQPPESQLHLVEAYLRQAADLVANARLRNSLQEECRRREEALSALARALAAPLSSLREAVEALRRPGSDDAAHTEARAILERETTRMTQSLGALLDACRHEADPPHGEA